MTPTLLLAAFLVAPLPPSAPPADPPPRPLILAHDMPWFVAKPTSPAWGWHWTMNAFNPDAVRPDGTRPIASHSTPLIGPYDSSDPAVIEYHLLTMKLAGIDGLIVDWYGLANHLDYPLIHRNTAALLAAAEKFGLKLAICYEDQTIPRLVAAGKLPAADRLAHARSELAWLREHWFTSPAYLTHDARPVLLSFGADGLTDAEWSALLPDPKGPDPAAPLYLSEHRRRPAAAGAFDWPIPSQGLAPLDRFEAASRDWPLRMPAAYPRFHDIYAEAKVQPSYGRIPDDSGRTFTTTLRRALALRPPFLQLVTWNDWGEGTAIEPSLEFGYRDLEALQRLRRAHLDPHFLPTPSDLRLPHRLYLLRRTRPAPDPTLDPIATHLSQGHYPPARAALDRLAP